MAAAQKHLIVLIVLECIFGHKYKKIQSINSTAKITSGYLHMRRLVIFLLNKFIWQGMEHVANELQHTDAREIKLDVAPDWFKMINHQINGQHNNQMEL